LQNWETFVFGYLNVDRPVLTEAVVGFTFRTEFSQNFHVVMFGNTRFLGLERCKEDCSILVCEAIGTAEDCSILGKELRGCYGR
jgi:hypothetical protein